MALDRYRNCNYIVVIKGVHFEWDTAKSVSNQKKHGVSFEEAATVFSDRLYIEIADEVHSKDEERYVALGLSSRCRLLVVCHTILGDGATVRIISARQATTTEERQYGEKTNAKRI